MLDILNKKQFKCSIFESNGIKFSKENAINKLQKVLIDGEYTILPENLIILCIQSLRTDLEGLEQLDILLTQYFVILANNIKTKIQNEIITFEKFINYYNKYSADCLKLQNILVLINNNIFIENKNYYTLVKINEFYKVMEEVDIFHKLFCDETISRSNIDDLYNVLQIFNMLFYIIPGTSIDSLSGVIPSNLLGDIISIINNTLIDKSLKKIISQKEQGIIKFLLKLCVSHNNVEYFMQQYIKDLQNRLIIKNTVIFELYLLDCFPSNKEYDEYIKRIMRICKDIKIGKTITKRICEFNNKQKYTEKTINVRIYDKQNWDVPDIFEGYIGNLNNPDNLITYLNTLIHINGTNIKYNYDKSTCIIKIGSLLIKCTLLQYCVLYVIIKGAVTATALASKLGINLSNISDTINSLLISKLIKKTGGTSKSDPNISLSFNEENITNGWINLIDTIEQVKRLLNHENTSDKIENLIKSKICDYLLTNKQRSKSEIETHITQQHADISMFNINTVIDKLLSKGIIITENNRYSLLE
jgi:hypothetical protein